MATISDYLHVRTPRIHRSTADRILAVRLEQVLPDPPVLAALGMVRRVQALMAIGHSPQAIAEAARCHTTTVTDPANGRGGEFVRPRTARRIATAYERLSARPGHHALSRRRAEENGWLSPLAWNDIDTDATSAPPVLNTSSRNGPTPLDETMHLAAGGATREQVAERLGMTWNAIEQAHHREAKPLPLAPR